MKYHKLKYPMELLDFGNVNLKYELTLPIKLHNTSNILIFIIAFYLRIRNKKYFYYELF